MELTWSGKVTLFNPSSAIAEVEFCQDRMTVSSNTGPGDVAALEALFAPQAGSGPSSTDGDGVGGVGEGEGEGE